MIHANPPAVARHFMHRHVWTAPLWQGVCAVDAAWSGCGHVSGLLVQDTRLLALM
jgi:hypothetical protein